MLDVGCVGHDTANSSHCTIEEVASRSDLHPKCAADYNVMWWYGDIQWTVVKYVEFSLVSIKWNSDHWIQSFHLENHLNSALVSLLYSAQVSSTQFRSIQLGLV